MTKRGSFTLNAIRIIFLYSFLSVFLVKVINLTNGQCKRLLKVFTHQVMKVKISTNICQAYLVLITFFSRTPLKCKNIFKNNETKDCKNRGYQHLLEFLTFFLGVFLKFQDSSSKCQSSDKLTLPETQFVLSLLQ